jgi:glycosyltransferase involved in cell wall biosynthesis
MGGRREGVARPGGPQDPRSTEPATREEPEPAYSARASIGLEASIIIPSYNSRRTVVRCLESVLDQQTEFRHEVIVVDSSSDGTDSIIRETFPGVRLLHSATRVSCGAARNLGVEGAGGELILFLDADCTVPRDWVQRMVSAMHDTNAHGICGSFANGTPRSISGTVGYFLEFFRFLGPRGATRPAALLVGGNSAYRKQIFRDAGFPDRSAGDDFDFSWRMAQRGLRLFVVPQIAVTHANRTGIRRVLHYQYALGQGAGRFRWSSSPGIMRALSAFPPAVVLLPPMVLVWIFTYVVARCKFSEAVRFLILSPLILVGSYAWGLGLLSELGAGRRRTAPDPAQSRG